MPITTDINTISRRDLIWRYLPDEVLDPDVFEDARSLVIMSDYPLPPLDPFFKGMLTTLKVLNMDVANLPERIPDSVRTLLFHNTTLSDIVQQIPANWANINTLVLSSNPLLNGTSLVVPDGVLEFKIISQQVHNIRFMGGGGGGSYPTTQVRKFSAEGGSFDKLTGHLPNKQILLYSTTRSIYTQPTQEIFRKYQKDILKVSSQHHYRLMDTRDKNILECVKKINDEMGYILYAEFGFIPKRIRVSEDNHESPIVVAMNLASNYPRRMAEFINEK